MRRPMEALLLVLIFQFLSTPSTMAQIRPETSASSAFSEPEGRPKSEGDYRPNVPGQPKVGAPERTGALSRSKGPFENQVHKGSDPMANGK